MATQIPNKKSPTGVGRKGEDPEQSSGNKGSYSTAAGLGSGECRAVAGDTRSGEGESPASFSTVRKVARSTLRGA